MPFITCSTFYFFTVALVYISGSFTGVDQKDGDVSHLVCVKQHPTTIMLVSRGETPNWDFSMLNKIK